MNKAYIIAFLVIGVALGFTMWSFGNSMTPYVDIQTALKSDTTVQVRGKILRDGSSPAPYFDGKALRFWIEDDKKSRIEVIYSGGKPDSFDTAPETAAHGMARRNPDGSMAFLSDKLIVKCPSKYDDNGKKALKPASTSPLSHSVGEGSGVRATNPTVGGV